MYGVCIFEVSTCGLASRFSFSDLLDKWIQRKKVFYRLVLTFVFRIRILDLIYRLVSSTCKLIPI